MIDNLLGIDTDVGGGGGGGGGVGVMILFFFLKDRSSLQYFITLGMGQSSMFRTFRTICNFRGRTSALVRVGGGKGGIPWLLHTCLL